MRGGCERSERLALLERSLHRISQQASFRISSPPRFAHPARCGILYIIVTTSVYHVLVHDMCVRYVRSGSGRIHEMRAADEPL